MQTATVISITAICLSITSLLWQVYVFSDGKKARLKLFDHYEIVRAEYSKNDLLGIVFTIMNSGSKKALINSIWIEYHLDQITPKPIQDVYNKFYQRNIRFPIQIPANDIYIFRPHISWGYSEHISLNLQSRDPLKMVGQGSYTYRECRVIVKDMKGKTYKSRWISVNKTKKEIENYPETVIIDYEFPEMI
ncbi:MAG: hypothetical protein JST70_13915 [Bacteroidetes bacterium]|nr:hypothetical protein [Bacteroidota bacterium]